MILEGAHAVFDSSSLPPAQRLGWWNSVVDSFSGIQTIAPTPDFRSRMERRSISDCKLFWIKCESPHRAQRLINNPDYCFFNIQLANEPVIFRGRSEFAVRRGGMACYVGQKGFEIDFQGNSESIVLAIPRKRLATEILNLDDHLREAHRYDERLVGVLASFCKGLFAIEGALCPVTEERLHQAIIHQLGAILCDADAEDSSSASWSQRATLHRVKTYILENIADTDLSPASIAAGTGLAISYLHKLFRNDLHRLMEFVKLQRLERCRAAIAMDRTGRSLSQIAFAWGFNDAWHFTRCFQKQFGMSPRCYRAQIRRRNDMFRKLRS